MTPIVKPLLDDRAYRYIKLPNKLEALLISDVAADKAAAAMDVRVGSLFDPPQWQGLAHFLEHMLFLGTSKYPAEDEYQSFLAKHGGSSNAFTADNHTCYFFAIAPEALPGALDRFGQFFISPLLTQSATDREVNAVHSEHSKNVQEDMWRQYQLMRTVCFDKRHPAHHFSTGNKETLGSVPREALLNFHNAWYSANVSRLAVLGKESLDELETLVRTTFEAVPNKDVVVPLGSGFAAPSFKTAIADVAEQTVDTSILSFPESLDRLTPPTAVSANSVPTINTECIKKQLFVVPVKEQRSIQFCWFLPEQRALWKSKPARYLSHILGHEGPGSLTSVLKARGFATDLVGGLSYDNAGVALFKVEVHLTKPLADALAADDNKLSELSEIVAAYVRLSNEQLSHTLWKEMEVVENLNFSFKPTIDPMTTVHTVANAMHYFPPSEVLAGPNRVYEFDEAAIKAHLDQLTMNNMFVTAVGKEFAAKCDQTEKWYGTKFGLHPLPEECLNVFARIERLNDTDFVALCKTQGLKMPPPNDFLPEDLTVRPLSDGSAKVPSVLSTSTATFFKQDNTFKMPKANAAFAIYSKFVQKNIQQYVATDLLLQCLNESHSQVAYQAEVAGLKYKLKATMEGVSLTFGGYSDKLPVIAQSVMEKLKNFSADANLFTLVKDRTVRQLQSQLMQKAPYSQAIDLSHQLLLSPYFSTAQKLNQVLATSAVSDLPSPGSVFSECTMEALIEGNMTKQGAEELSTSVVNGLPKTATLSPVSSVKVMELDRDVVLQRRGVNPNETNGAVVVSVQTGWVAGHVSESDEADLKTAAFMALTSQICGQKFFDDLRTKQQLGYIVHSAGSVQERRAGLLFLVQSEAPTTEVKDRMFEFINKLDVTIDAITKEELGEYIAAVVTDLKEKPKNQGEEFQRHWVEIEKRRFDFNRKDRLIPAVEAICKEELVNYIRQHVMEAPKVVAIVTGANESDAQEILPDPEVARIRESAKWVRSNSAPVVRNQTSKI